MSTECVSGAKEDKPLLAVAKPASPLLVSSVQDSADELHHAQKPQLFGKMT